MEERIAAASGEVKLEDEETLKKIRSDFDAMTKIRQAMVVNYYSLVAQEMDLEKLKKDTAIAEAISERIAALGEITFESEETLTALRKDYTALTTAQKKIWSEIMSCLHRQKINWQISNTTEARQSQLLKK